MVDVERAAAVVEVPIRGRVLQAYRHIGYIFAPPLLCQCVVVDGTASLLLRQLRGQLLGWGTRVSRDLGKDESAWCGLLLRLELGVEC